MGRLICCFGNEQRNIPKLCDLLEEIPSSNQNFEGYNVEHELPSIGYHGMLLDGRRTFDSTCGTKMMLLTIVLII